MDKLDAAASYVKQTIAVMKGDTDQALAEKNYRKSGFAIAGQLAALNQKASEVEDQIEEAEMNLKIAKYPATLITDGASYLSNIKGKKDEVNRLKNELDRIRTSIKEHKELQDEFDGKEPEPKKL